MNIFFKKIILFVFGLSGCVVSAQGASYQLDTSSIEYKVSYTFKTVVGKSDSARGKGVCQNGECQFLIAVPLKMFNSGDSNRDLKALQVTKATQHPITQVTLRVPQKKLSGDFTADIELNFAGVKQTVEGVAFKVKSQGDTIHVESGFNLELSKHGVERPTLLTIPIDDIVPIKIQSDWKES